jgi:hypothetical protein
MKDAWHTCEGLGGSLASIKDRRQNQFLGNILLYKYLDHQVLIGLRNFDPTPKSEANPKNWAWMVNDKRGNIVQRPASFTKWELSDEWPVVPTPGYGSCTFVAVRPDTFQMTWRNCDCNTPRPFVCELDIEVVITLICGCAWRACIAQRAFQGVPSCLLLCCLCLWLASIEFAGHVSAAP